MAINFPVYSNSSNTMMTPKEGLKKLYGELQKLSSDYVDDSKNITINGKTLEKSAPGTLLLYQDTLKNTEQRFDTIINSLKKMYEIEKNAGNIGAGG